MKSESESSKSVVLGAAAAGLGALWLGSRVRRQFRKFDLAGRTVLITGGSRGLGLALAREFTARQARVAVCARDEAELKVAADDIRQRGGQLHTFVCDLHDKQQIAEMIRKVEAEVGVIDVLVNNAGTIIVGPQEAMTLEDYEEAMAVNFWSAVNTCLALAPSMSARGEGRIVNIASIGGKMPVPHLLPYCASKFALVGFSSGLRAELVRKGVLVATINPGLMRTGSPRNASFKGNNQAEYAWFTIGDVTPGVSMSAASAARRIVNSTIYGDAEVTLSWAAKLGATFYGLAPQLHSELSGWVNRLLPNYNGNRRIHRGFESESALTRSPLLFLNQRAQRDLNQLQT